MASTWPVLALVALPWLLTTGLLPFLAVAGGLLGFGLVAAGLLGIVAARLRDRDEPPEPPEPPEPTIGQPSVAASRHRGRHRRRPRQPRTRRKPRHWVPVGVGSLLDLTWRETQEPLRRVPEVELPEHETEETQHG